MARKFRPFVYECQKEKKKKGKKEKVNVTQEENEESSVMVILYEDSNIFHVGLDGNLTHGAPWYLI